MGSDDVRTPLFDDPSHLLAAPMDAWLDSSRRFTAFVTTFHSKIRKKLRATHDVESLHDLRLELETAYLLLQERALSLAYEPQHAGHTRRPDFAVSFTTSLVFMLEVTRLRMAQASPCASSEQQPPAGSVASSPPTPPPVGERLVDTICGKLSQLLPQQPNVLLVGVEGACPTPTDLRALMLRVQQRAERNDSAFLHRHGFRDRRDFFQHYQRLSEVLVRGVPLQAGAALGVWVNPQAKHPLPGKVRTVLYRSHTP